ncbi:MAG: T9SS type A sorting domain-containing protein [Candidatus Marinimicrobia bacterium]|nr:T9SS type A sorting domain-containing protein [Candidatus Neomarinimicrobiota bacterium]
MKSLQLLLISVIMFSAVDAYSQPFPLKTIREVQEPTDIGVTDWSDFVGDTVRVGGIVATGPRDIWIGARWSFFLVDTAGGSWSGIQIVQEDCTETATDVGLLQIGDSIIVTGVVEEFFNGTQLQILTDPVVAIDFRDQITLGTFPQRPIDVTLEELQNAATGEQYEEVLVRLSNVKMINSDVGGGEALIESSDGAFQLGFDDWYDPHHTCFENSSCTWPPNGAPMNVIGWIRDRDAAAGLARYMIAPWSLGLPYIEVLAKPPVISNIVRTPGVPSSSDAVVVTANVVDNSLVGSSSLMYSVDGGAFVEAVMTGPVSDVYAGTIPAQVENSLVKYFISAVDDSGFSAISPGDTARGPLFYIVRDGALTIQDIQFNPFGSGNSGYEDLEVTTSGIVTSDSIQYGSYWIQNGRGPWSGLQINDNANNPEPGDEVQVTGIVNENFGFTRLDAISAFEVLSTGNAVPAPRVFKTGDINSDADSAEAYESVLVEIRNAIISDELPDAPNNFGEFSVDDGSGELRVDDLAAAFDGNNPMIYFNGDSVQYLRGYLYWSFGNYKIVPRDTNDIKGTFSVYVKDEGGIMPDEYILSQNYPNPFNPQTDINYSLPVAGAVRLTVYNLLGQRVASLVNEFQQAGNYRASWNGRDEFGKLLSSGIYFYNLNVDNGKFSKTKKMLLLK